MNFQTALILLSIASPVVAGGVGWLIKHALKKQDDERAMQTSLIQSIKNETATISRTLSKVETQVGYHDDEIKRFRSLIDRWNPGPFSK